VTGLSLLSVFDYCAKKIPLQHFNAAVPVFCCKKMLIQPGAFITVNKKSPIAGAYNLILSGVEGQL